MSDAEFVLSAMLLTSVFPSSEMYMLVARPGLNPDHVGRVQSHRGRIETINVPVHARCPR